MRESTLDYRAYSRSGYVPSLDVIRAIAVLSVVLYHVHGGIFDALHGFRGVTVFFVLSGYLITTLCLREEDRRGALDVRGFVIRRVFRILPLYYVVLAVYVVLVLMLHLDSRTAAFRHALPWYLTYLQEWPIIHGGVQGTPLGVSWSLGIEEKFYVVWPVLAFVLLRARRGRAALSAGIAAAIVVVSIVQPVPTGQLLVHYTSIMAGAVLAFVLHRPRSYERLRFLGRPPVCAALAVVVALLWVAPTPELAEFVPVPDIPIFVIPVALLLGGLVTAGPALARIASPAPLVHVGRLSYAIYLTHQIFLNGADRVLPAGLHGPARAALTLLIAVPVTLVVCELLHRLIERPMIRAGHRLGRPRPLPGPSAQSRAEPAVPRAADV
jgi:peptidoglycan/LPS O-acetylase OafA/YrhL